MIRLLALAAVLHALAACSRLDACRNPKVEGTYDAGVHSDVVMVALQPGGVGNIQFADGLATPLRWEFEPEGPQALLTGDTQTMEKLRTLAHGKPPPPDAAPTQRTIVAVGLNCERTGRVTELIVGVDDPLILTRSK